MATETDQAYEKIQAIVKAKPELSSAAAAKLAEVVQELEKLNVNDATTTSPDVSALKTIHQGFHTFKTEVYDKKTEHMDKLKTGQWPKFMVIACADSRVSPTTILGLQPGDAFMVRNIANMIPAYNSEKTGNPSMASALEYAVIHLKVKHILIIGHRACGGVGALVKMTPDDGKYSTDFIERWVEIGKPARVVVREKLEYEGVEAMCKSCEKESVTNSLNNLLSYPFVVEAVSHKKITLHGGYYDHIEGSFQTWDFGLKD